MKKAIIEQIKPGEGIVLWLGNNQEYLTGRFPKIAAATNGNDFFAVEVTEEDMQRVWEKSGTVVTGTGKQIGFTESAMPMPHVRAHEERVALKLTLALVK